ncbi:hypothetical protein NQ314_010365 [Rhamnusium bicolor]|uniref:PiggyBac transposable element-derived protein domain-containing protein n=1 Tax=Rhamnusium bicolor TaxID=1586634 RepID=A0AAV8XRC9_9CUCU|nr:hypothetical protein NQ314_010365 [Rhamnusium bicolor]
MSVSSLPRTRAYWRSDIGVSNIQDVMTINEFEKIKNTLHFNDNNTVVGKDDPKYDELHKIRPLIDHLNSRFSYISLEPQLAIDEQICATKFRNHMKQYLPICSVGLQDILKEDEPGLGVTGNVVVRLTRIVPKNLNYCIYFDNFYSSVPLMVHLANQGIYRLATVRRNRIPNNKLLEEKEMKKVDRGTSEEYVANVDGVDLSAVAWKDNKTVSLLSTAYGELPLHKVTRIQEKKENCNKKNLWEFRLEIAQCLCLMGPKNEKKRGRPSSGTQQLIEEKRKREPATHVPPMNVRNDETSHWIKYDSARQRCKYATCKSYTHFKCDKCSVFLCLTKDKNCFRPFLS